MPQLTHILLLRLAATVSIAAVAGEVERLSHDAALVVFTLVRGDQTEDNYISFINSRRCIRDAVGGAVVYDDVAFHEGNVAPEMQRRLQRRA